MSSTLGLP